MKRFRSFALSVMAVVWVASGVGSRAASVDFIKEVQPLLELHCVKCHGPEKPKGGLRLDTLAGALKGGDDGSALVAGKPLESSLYTTTILPADHDDVMPPPKEGRLNKAETDTLKAWIEEGAKWPEGLTLSVRKKINFAKDIQPIFEFNCVACHREGHDKGDLRMDEKELAFKGGESGTGIVRGSPDKSPIYTTTILPADHDDLMPPSNKGGPLPKETTELIRAWIEQGAPWPDGLKLTPKKAEEAPGANDAVTSADIQKKILSHLKVTEEKDMKPYKDLISGTGVTFEMLPIPGGKVTVGSPNSESGRKDDEGPQVSVSVQAFWMGKFEVTWNEFELFMYPEEEKKRIASNNETYKDDLSDAVSRPTKPYVEMSFGMGRDGFPAISMTQHAANKYCQWLSARTGHFYRLPTEAEWEDACRAGTTTPYSFGDDESKLGEYAWFGDNSDFKYQKVGKKKPNPWGLHDMHGNVAEWCLDQYFTNYASKVVSLAVDPWIKATQPYPHSVRGGSWDDAPDKLRSAARRGSNKNWKIQDPQLPKSIWYHTDAQFLGFRIVRPLKVPPPEEIQKYWTSGVEKE